MSLPRYAEYKDSGVTWLGDIPTRWEVKRIKHTTYLKGRVGWKGLTSDEYLESGYAYLVTGTDFSKKFINWRECHCVEQARYEDDPFIQLRDGDLLITKDGTIGKLALVSGLDRPACLNSGIFLIRPTSGYVTEYMYWVLQSKAFNVFCDLSSLGSTIQHLYQNVFEDFAFPVPSLPEQRSIAAFLDRETAKIDALIAEQEKLITLLAEKRQATISHVVTRGLNPDAPMKDSSVAWLGAVPAHWNVRPLKYVGRVGNGSTPNRDNPHYWTEEGFPWLNSSVVNQDEVTEAQQFVTQQALDECHLPVIQPPAILVGITGQGKTRGMATKLMFVATVNQHLAYIKPSEQQVSVDFLLLVLEAAYEHLRTDSEGAGSTKGAITCDQLERWSIPVPSIEEQLCITGFLATEGGKLDRLRVEAERAIALLKERRSALIAAAVTGQVDVRGKVAQPASTAEALTA
jgi:type I restriction enzyme, S subunit